MCKIICTLGPATSREKDILGLIHSGMDVARLNFSHGSLQTHSELIRRVRSARSRAGRGTGILIDLPGPKLRAGRLPETGMEIAAGEKVMLASRPDYSSTGLKTIPFHNPPVLNALRPHMDVFLADGTVHLKVLSVKDGRALCLAMTQGALRSGCGINIPNADIPIKAFTPKDREYLKFGLKNGADFVAVSFVSGPQDIRAVRRAVKSGPGQPLIIAKIERRRALENLKEIVRESDAVMVARGDLGVELPPAKVPFAQKEIIAECTRQGRPAIVATQMLESMVTKPQPTRAELTDIANAVLDGADAVMLSAETSIGKYPLKAVRTLSRVLLEAEKHVPSRPINSRPSLESLGSRSPSPEAEDSLSCSTLSGATASSAAALAEGICARAIVIPVFTGETARLVSRLRPRCHVVALCAPGKEPGFSLLRGIRAFGVKDLKGNLENLISLSKRVCRKLEFAGEGDSIVMACSMPGNDAGRIVTAMKI